MLQKITDLQRIIEEDLASITDTITLDAFRLKHLVKKGTLQTLIDELRTVPKDEKPAIGKALNLLRSQTEERFESLAASLRDVSTTPTVDVSLPGRRMPTGVQHPIQTMIHRTIDVFHSLGFEVAEGFEIEDDEHNFGKLNFAVDHPARDMQDTFFVAGVERSDILLRTHTSSVQIRVMESMTPPIRCIMPGKVYRNEAVSARSLAEFHQIEGLAIDRDITVADLKATIMEFARRMYDASVRFRFRTSYFPFTEPSMEVDMSCYLCDGDGCRICKQSGWLEICGAGMVHPNVLAACGIDPEEFSGFAFGFGVERVVMLQTGIDDIRLLYENDLRILGQFRS
jgi:phenylalanyl-tRNA synthetase alpha chain